jgi:hypothetical protein
MQETEGGEGKINRDNTLKKKKLNAGKCAQRFSCWEVVLISTAPASIGSGGDGSETLGGQSCAMGLRWKQKKKVESHRGYSSTGAGHQHARWRAARSTVVSRLPIPFPSFFSFSETQDRGWSPCVIDGWSFFFKLDPCLFSLTLMIVDKRRPC